MATIMNWFAHLKQVGRFLLKHKWLLTLVGVLVVGLSVYSFQQYQLHQREVQTQRQLTRAIKSFKHQKRLLATRQQQGLAHAQTVPQNPQRPILLLHGFGGSYNSEKYIIASLHQTHLVKQQLMVYVDKHSHVHLMGKYHPTAAHKEVIPIVIKNNHAGEFYYSAMLAKIMPELNRKYHIKDYDAVGHSMGCQSYGNCRRNR